MHEYEKIYEFAASLGSLEGYVYGKRSVRELDLDALENWSGNIVEAYGHLPDTVKSQIRDRCDQTAGRAIRSLELVLGTDHLIIRRLHNFRNPGRPLPESADSFDKKNGLPVKTEPCSTAAEDSFLLSGIVVSGARQAAFFTQLDWVRSQCLDQLGFEPFPGTLNLKINEKDQPAAAKVLTLPGLPLAPPDSNFCAGRVYPVCIGTIPGGIVLPEEDVRVHDTGVLEILAPVSLRDALHLEDGDRVTLAVRL